MLSLITPPPSPARNRFSHDVCFKIMTMVSTLYKVIGLPWGHLPFQASCNVQIITEVGAVQHNS